MKQTTCAPDVDLGDLGGDAALMTLRRRKAELEAALEARKLREEVAKLERKVADAEAAAESFAELEAAPRERILINLPKGSGGCLLLDGRSYYHDRVYDVRPDQIPVFLSMMSAAWAHENERRGESRWADIQKTAASLRPSTDLGAGLRHFYGV